MNDLLFSNQYIAVTGHLAEKPSAFLEYDFDPLTIYVHPKLAVTIIRKADRQAALMGIIVDPSAPWKSKREVVSGILEHSTTSDQFLKNTRALTGRYVLFFKNGTSFLACGDACHLRQIYYGTFEGHTVLTSSLKLFLHSYRQDLMCSDEKLYLIQHPLFKQTEQSWYGVASPDDRLQKLLPNHYLDIPAQKAVFLEDTHLHDDLSQVQITDKIAGLLQGAILALSKKHNLIQPLTAGIDSRLLLAAGREISDKITYYVFDRSKGKNPDAVIPGMLADKLGLQFKKIKPDPLKETFLGLFKREHIEPRILPKTVNIQHHFYSHHPANTLNMNGNGAEIGKNFYGYSFCGCPVPGGTIARCAVRDMLFVFSGYGRRIPFVVQQINQWYDDAVVRSETSNIPLFDLFYWEQRMGHWGAHYPFEQDIVMEEVSAFNNRELLLLLLSVKPQLRCYPKYRFFMDLINHMWPDLISVPINPGSWRPWKVAARYSEVRYLGQKVTQLIKQ